MKNFFAMIIGWAIIFVNFSATFAAPNPNPKAQWYWLKSDDMYSKYFDPDSVTVVKKTKVLRHIKKDDGTEEVVEKEVPTEIEAWTKTVCTYEGAAATIANYKITDTFPDPGILSYTLTLFRINPQSRTIQCAREDFFDSKDKVIWSWADGPVREVNSQLFNEDFYAAIVDEVFNQGEVERKSAKDRWLDLWTHTNAEGYTTKVTGDTTTMRMRGTNLIFWEWQETKNSDGKTVEIKFMKKSVNLHQGTEKMSNGEVWTPATKTFKDFEDENGGGYRMIKNTDPEYQGLVRLRAYAKGFATWVTRYSIS